MTTNPCTCRDRFPEWAIEQYEHYEDCPSQSAPPRAPAPPPPGRGPAPVWNAPVDYTNNDLGAGAGGFAPRLVLDVTPPEIAQNAILAGSNLAIAQELRPDAWDENANVRQYAAAAVRVRKDRVRGWERQDGSAVTDRNGEQVKSVECTLVHNNPAFNGMAVEIASGGAAITKAMEAVPDGVTVNIVRLPDVGRMRQYRIMQAL